jgi:hypothetical protein
VALLVILAMTAACWGRVKRAKGAKAYTRVGDDDDEMTAAGGAI